MHRLSLCPLCDLIHSFIHGILLTSWHTVTRHTLLTVSSKMTTSHRSGPPNQPSTHHSTATDTSTAVHAPASLASVSWQQPPALAKQQPPNPRIKTKPSLRAAASTQQTPVDTPPHSRLGCSAPPHYCWGVRVSNPKPYFPSSGLLPGSFLSSHHALDDAVSKQGQAHDQHKGSHHLLQPVALKGGGARH